MLMQSVIDRATKTIENQPTNNPTKPRGGWFSQ